MQIANIKLKNEKLMGFSFENLHFATQFSVPFQNAKLIPPNLRRPQWKSS